MPPLHVKVSRILTIGQRFSGEGFDDMKQDDIYEIMNESTDLTETDLIQLTTESPSVSNLKMTSLRKKISVNQFPVSL